MPPITEKVSCAGGCPKQPPASVQDVAWGTSWTSASSPVKECQTNPKGHPLSPLKNMLWIQLSSETDWWMCSELGHSFSQCPMKPKGSRCDVRSLAWATRSQSSLYIANCTPSSGCLGAFYPLGYSERLKGNTVYLYVTPWKAKWRYFLCVCMWGDRGMWKCVIFKSMSKYQETEIDVCFFGILR